MWSGAGAEELGLAGPVRSRDFKRVLDGWHPTEDAQLVRGSSAAGGKRVAALMTLIGRDDRVVVAHDEAVRIALAAVEEVARARREVEVFTDSRADLPYAASREAPKHAALTFGLDLTR